MERAVYSSLGRPSRKLLVGPGIGLDNGIVSIGKGRVMILTVDPISAIPSFGMRLSAWLSVHLIASDYTTSGRNPEYATFSYNFPTQMISADREEYLRSIGKECRSLRIAIAGGHTGSYPGGGFTVIGAGTMLGFATGGEYVTPSMARVGDSILMTKHAAIEATGSLALSFPMQLEKKIGRRVTSRACRLLHLCTTVEDARTATRVGIGRNGVTSMHDATEGGVLGGLAEMAVASARRFEVDLAKVPVSTEAMKVCAAFGLDPLATMGEGALLLTCRPEKVPELGRKMTRAGIPVSQIGIVKKEGHGLRLYRDGFATAYRPRPDGYWAAYDLAAGGQG